MERIAKWYVCRECGYQVRPGGVTPEEAPGTRRDGSAHMRLCDTDYKRFRRENPDWRAPSKKVYERRAPEPRGPLTPAERTVEEMLGRWIDRDDDRERVAKILGLVDEVTI